MALYLTFTLLFFCFASINAARLLFSLYALSLGAHPIAVGILYATYFIFPVLLSWPVGVLADRLGTRWLLLFATLCDACAILIPYYVRELPALYVAGTMMGLAFSFYKVLLENMVGLLSKPHERARNFSNSSMVGASSGFAGPLVAGIAIDYFGHATACLPVMALSLTAAALLLAWGGILPGGARHAESHTSVRDTLRDRRILKVLALSCFVQVGQDFFQFYIPIYGHSIGLAATAIGGVLASYSIASFVVRFVLPRLLHSHGEETLLAYALFIGAAGFALMPFCPNAVTLAIVVFVFGLGMGCGQPVTTMMLFSRTTPGRSGETFGLRQTANNVLRLVTPTVFGFIASALGLFPAFGVSAFMLVAGGMLSKSGGNDKRMPR